MTDIEIKTIEGKTTLKSPYNPELPPKARKIGGKFAYGLWHFDARDEQRVRDIAIEVYGTTGTPSETKTVRINMDDYDGDEQELWLFGRCVARRPGRDYSVKLGDGVIVTEGGFGGRGGSVKNPRLDPREGTVLEIRDVPAQHPELTEYADRIEVIDEAIDIDALTDERERLLARIAEIDAMLPEPEGTEMTTREAATALGVSVRTVQRWASTGRVESRKTETGRWVITITA